MRPLLIFAVLGINFNATAQTTYDVYTYTEPANFVKDASNTGAVTYAHQTDSAFCVIGLYQNVPTKGTVQKDFDAAWKGLLSKMKLTAAAQKQPVQNADGWNMLTGYAPIKFEGVPSVIYLNTISGNGIAANIMYLTNSESYSKVLEDFQTNLDVNKPITKTEKEIGSITSNTSSIFGEWYLSDGNAKMTLLFGTNGKYDKGAMVDRRIISNLYETTSIKGKGTYSLNGSTLTLTPTSGSKEVYQIRFSTDKDDEGKPIKILHLKKPVEGGQLYESDYYFVPQKEEPKKPNATVNTTNSFALLNGEGITGVWINYGNNSPFLSNSSVGFNWRVFFNNGKSLSNLPNGGFANLKNNTYLDNTKNEANSFNLGTYNFSNGKGTNTKSGSNYTDKLELIKSNQLKIDGTVYMKCSNVNGQKLQGTFTTYADPNDPDLLSQPKGNRSVISFTTDGNFIDEGIYQILLKDYGQSEAYNASGKGTYELKDYSIILKFDDGRIKQESFTIPFSNTTSNANMILISSVQLNKMK